MDPVLNIIYKVKALPTIYIGRKSITSLLDFVGGYIICLNDFVGFKNRSFYLEEFYRYVQAYYGLTEIPIRQIFLEQCCNDEAKAFEQFYELLGSYLNQ